MTTKDTAAVTEAIETLRKAMISGDRAVLDKVTAENLTWGHTSGRTETKSQFIEGVASGKSAFDEIELSNQAIDVTDNIAVVRHVFSGTRRGAPAGNAERELGILLVWLKRAEQWKVVARQSVVLKKQ